LQLGRELTALDVEYDPIRLHAVIFGRLGQVNLTPLQRYVAALEMVLGQNVPYCVPVFIEAVSAG